jgi:hypothetical protein
MRTRIALATFIVLAAFLTEANGQSKPSDSSRTQTPAESTGLITELPSPRKTREQLIKSLENLLTHIQTTDQLIADLEKAGDGSADVQRKICMLRLIKERDRAAMMNPIAASMTQLRFSMDREVMALNLLARRREVDAQKTQIKVERMADKALLMEEEISRIQDADERQDAERNLAELKAEIQDHIKLREERQMGVKTYQKAAGDLQREKKSLDSIDRFLARESRNASTRVDRYCDAVQHGGLDVLRDQSDEGRQTLETAMELIKKIKDAPPVSMPPTVRPVPKLGVEPPATEARVLPSMQVEEELKKARERRLTAK